MSKHKSEIFRAANFWHPRYWVMWISIGLLRLAALLPYSSILALGRSLGRLLRHLSPSRQRIVDINLKKCFPEFDTAKLNQIKTQCYDNIGISLMEMAICWWWKAEKLEPMVEIRGQHHIDKVLESGRGVILLTGHFTSLEIGARLLTLFMPVQVMYRAQRNRLFDSYLFTRRSRYFVNTVSRKNTRRLLKGIKTGIPTWYAPDQDFRRERNAFVPFMGIQTATITATSRLAQSSGGVILPYFPERKLDGSGYILWIGEPIETIPSGNDENDAVAINQSIEKFIQLHPAQYAWVHQRFKTRPPGEPEFYQ
jgi:Kdo2-lipid IVA lauroyltransferase/acyltransferase